MANAKPPLRDNGENHMALAPCRECGRQVSTEAATCRHCGVGRPARRIATPSLPKNHAAPDQTKRSAVKAAFVVGIGIAILIAIIQSGTTASSSSSGSSTVTTATAVSFVPGVVRLDWAAGEMEIRGRIAKPPGAQPPGTVWVWAYYVNPTVNPSASWSDEPIAVTTAFSNSDTATIVARGPFHWSGTSYTTPTGDPLPRRGYFAQVRVSAVSADDARIPSSSRDYETARLLRVK